MEPTGVTQSIQVFSIIERILEKMVHIENNMNGIYMKISGPMLEDSRPKSDSNPIEPSMQSFLLMIDSRAESIEKKTCTIITAIG